MEEINEMAQQVTLSAEGDLEQKKGKGSKSKGGKKDKQESRYPKIKDGIAMTKSITVSNGAMMACRFDVACNALESEGNPQFETSSIQIKTVHGRTGRKDTQSPEKEDKKNSTLYEGDEATLPDGADSVYIPFELSVRNAVHRPHSISADNYLTLRKVGFFDQINRFTREIFLEVAKNVFSGRWAWRNHSESDDFVVVVTTKDDERIRDAETLAERMHRAFEGTPEHFVVHGVFRMGTGIGGTPVFPSQLMAVGAPKHFFEVDLSDGRSVPALRGVKIGNRLREMDVWYAKYPQYEERLPVETLGYSLWLRTNLRDENESLQYYLNEILDGRAEKVFANENAVRFLCGNALFGFLATDGKKADE